MTDEDPTRPEGPGTDDPDAGELTLEQKIQALATEGPKKQRTVNLPHALLERARAAAGWLTYEGPDDEPLNLSGLFAVALAKEVSRLETAYNGGRPFKTVRRELRRGRPGGPVRDED